MTDSARLQGPPTGEGLAGLARAWLEPVLATYRDGHVTVGVPAPREYLLGNRDGSSSRLPQGRYQLGIAAGNHDAVPSG